MPNILESTIQRSLAEKGIKPEKIELVQACLARCNCGGDRYQFIIHEKNNPTKEVINFCTKCGKIN